MAKSKTTKAGKAKATKSNAGGKPRRAKQTEIPGTERVQHADLRAALERLDEADVALGEAHEERTDAAGAVLALMKKKKLPTYLDEQLKKRVDVVAGEPKLRVKSLEKKSEASA